MKKKLLALSALLLISTLHAVPSMAGNSASRFLDMRDHWANESVAIAIDKKYVDGYEDGSFWPENSVSTAEFIKMVVTATKMPISGKAEGVEWYLPYVQAAIEKGIVRQDSISTDVLNKPMSRLDMVKVAVRATDPLLQGKEVSINDQGAMFTATSKGIVQGVNNGELAPKAETTRAQSVTIIERILSLNAGEKLEVDKQAISNAELELKRTNIFSMIPIFGGKQGESTSWSPAKLVMETKDGLFRGEIDQVVAIDMANPNDPNRGMLGDISELHWFPGETTGPMPLVADYPDSYVILIKEHVDYVKDTEAYSAVRGPALTIYGFKSLDKQALANGELNTLAPVFRNKRGDMQAYILPKTGFGHGESISFTLSAPARPPHDDETHTITSIWAPNNK